MGNTAERHQQVQDYYGKVLSSTDDLQTNACCTATEMPPHLKQALARIHDEVLARYYGCGLTIPDGLGGCAVLDLGSGAGRDVYLVSQLVGEQGEVVGVDMTPEQLAVAESHRAYHAEQFGHARSNVRFLEGHIERLDLLDLPDDHFDVIISNCVINLATDKRRVLDEAFRVLKPGGELYFSDVYADRRIPEHLVDDPVLYGECLSGALYWNDFLTLAKAAGFADPRVVESEPLAITNPAVAETVGDIRFVSTTHRLFKLDGLEPACEDYGHTARYLGTIDHAPEVFVLDGHHRFPRGEAVPVCGNSYRMLADTRFAPHFDLAGSWDSHRGLFGGCGSTDLPFGGKADTPPASACC